VKYSWPYSIWWRGAARAIAPAALRSFVRRYLRRHGDMAGA
jgi:hypothetical protein